MQTIVKLSIEDYEDELTTIDLIEFLGKVPADTRVTKLLGRVHEIVYDSEENTVDIS